MPGLARFAKTKSDELMKGSRSSVSNTITPGIPNASISDSNHNSVPSDESSGGSFQQCDDFSFDHDDKKLFFEDDDSPMSDSFLDGIKDSDLLGDEFLPPSDIEAHFPLLASKSDDSSDDIAGSDSLEDEFLPPKKIKMKKGQSSFGSPIAPLNLEASFEIAEERKTPVAQVKDDTKTIEKKSRETEPKKVSVGTSRFVNRNTIPVALANSDAKTTMKNSDEVKTKPNHYVDPFNHGEKKLAKPKIDMNINTEVPDHGEKSVSSAERNIGTQSDERNCASNNNTIGNKERKNNASPQRESIALPSPTITAIPSPVVSELGAIPANQGSMNSREETDQHSIEQFPTDPEHPTLQPGTPSKQVVQDKGKLKSPPQQQRPKLKRIVSTSKYARNTTVRFNQVTPSTQSKLAMQHKKKLKSPPPTQPPAPRQQQKPKLRRTISTSKCAKNTKVRFKQVTPSTQSKHSMPHKKKLKSPPTSKYTKDSTVRSKQMKQNENKRQSQQQNLAILDNTGAKSTLQVKQVTQNRTNNGDRSALEPMGQTKQVTQDKQKKRSKIFRSKSNLNSDPSSTLKQNSRENIHNSRRAPNRSTLHSKENDVPLDRRKEKNTGKKSQQVDPYTRVTDNRRMRKKIHRTTAVTRNSSSTIRDNRKEIAEMNQSTQANQTETKTPVTPFGNPPTQRPVTDPQKIAHQESKAASGNGDQESFESNKVRFLTTVRETEDIRQKIEINLDDLNDQFSKEYSFLLRNLEMAVDLVDRLETIHELAEKTISDHQQHH